MIMFKELPPLNPGSGGVTESSEEMRRRANVSPPVLAEREKLSRLRALSPEDRSREIRYALDAHDLETARYLASATGDEQPTWQRFLYDEYMRRGEYLRAALLAKTKLSVDPRSTTLHNFTDSDVRRAAISAYHAAKENPQPIEKMDEPPVPFKGYVPNDFETSDAELIKREFGLSDEDLGNLPKAA